MLGAFLSEIALCATIAFANVADFLRARAVEYKASSDTSLRCVELPFKGICVVLSGSLTH